MTENRSGAWPSKPLREVAQVVSGGTPSRYVPEFWEDGTIPWVTPTDLTNTSGRFLSDTREKITHRGLSSCSATLLPVGTLLMTSRATLGEIRIAGCEVCTNQGFKSLVPFPDTHGRFLYYQMLQNKERYRSLGIGSTFLEVNKRDTERFEVLVPPDYGNQKRIAEILSTVDEAIEQTEALIAKTQQIKAGLMHALFTRGVTEEGQLRPTRQEAPHLYKESPLGWIPKEWEVDIFGSRISVIDPNPSHRYPEEQEVGVPICSTENFRGEDGFDLSKSKLMPLYVLTEQQQRCHFRKNDVVFARKGRIGLARRYGDEPKVFSHTVVIFKAVVASVDQDWLLWLSRSHWFLSDIDRRMNSNSGVPTLGVAFINAVTVPFPPADEQQVINRHLDEISVRESAEVAELQKLRSLKAGLMQDLLSGAVSVAFEHQPGRKEVAAGV